MICTVILVIPANYPDYHADSTAFQTAVCTSAEHEEGDPQTPTACAHSKASATGATVNVNVIGIGIVNGNPSDPAIIVRKCDTCTVAVSGGLS